MTRSVLPPEPSFVDSRETRARFLALIAEVRPDLHRYCARMTGSVTDGEDVVQDTLARAYALLPEPGGALAGEPIGGELPAMPELRPWLFRVAHHRAIDLRRRYERRNIEPLDIERPALVADLIPADDALAQHEAVAAALARFVELPPIPRSCVILKDVLGHSLDEIASLLELGLPAVKAALHRGRQRLLEARSADDDPPPERPVPSPAIARYVALFNARDWDGVRAMLADDVRLDVVSRSQRRGRRDVGQYVSNYAGAHDWHLRRAWLGDREVIAVARDAEAEPTYFVELTLRDDQVLHIRDYRYVPYIAVDAALRAE